ncbi:hypothetical protein QBC47DRAFT_220128 [Echria macrotheca]|uniref:Uncharacterized protein n=1 Tax=Echria macrotheca TaxID=438768 RepID=A0AAJ0BC37_9PEZI|nr:hypothetical protein QBC47DRAFT_220128 [Echria macrotheca]
MTKFGSGWLGGSLLVGLGLWGTAATAAFSNSFDDIAAGSTVDLTWDEVPAKYYPLCVTAQLVQKGDDGHTATAYKANLTLTVTAPSFSWTGVPFPLQYSSGGMYQLELHPASGESVSLARSPFFSIKAQNPPATAPSPSSSPKLADPQSGTATGINKPLAIGLGVAIGVPSVVALGLVSWCFRKRQRRAIMEKRRRNRREFIID